MPMTRQEVFTKVVTHMLKQSKQAREVYNPSSSGPCRYRTEGGLMCAVGCLVPDEIYHDSMEGTILHGVIERANEGMLPEPLAQFVKAELEPHVVLLRDLQYAHDHFDPEEWRDQLASTGERCGLTMPASSKGA